MWFNRTDKPLTAAYDCTTMITLGFRQKMLMETNITCSNRSLINAVHINRSQKHNQWRDSESWILSTRLSSFISCFCINVAWNTIKCSATDVTLIPALSSGSGIPDYHAEWLRVSHKSTAVLHPIEDPLTVCLNTEARARLQTPHTPPLWLQKHTATEDRQTGHVLQWSYHGNVNIKQNCTSSLQYTSLVLLWTIHQCMLFQRKLNVCHWSERSPQKQLFFLTLITVSLVEDPVSLRNMSRSRRKLLKL